MSIGNELGMLSQRVASLEENITPDIPEDQLVIGYNDVVAVTGEYTVSALIYDDDSLVFNHVVQGDLNVFVWNGGYSGYEVFWI